MAHDMTGITTRHTSGGSLRFRAEAYDSAQQRRIYKTFPGPSPVAAIRWRRDIQTRIARGEVRAAEPTTIKEAWESWIFKAEAGEIRSRGGTPYKPSVLHGYKITFESRLLQQFGRTKVGELRRAAIQRYVDQLVGEGLAAQTIKNVVTALRVVLKWCVREELIHANPCDGLELPSGETVRDRIATPAEARELLAALEGRDRAILACAFYAGLRRGELMGLRWSDVHLAEKRIEVRQAFDPRTRTFGRPKSGAGYRVGSNAPGIPDVLVPVLEEQYERALQTGVSEQHLVFGTTSWGPQLHKPFDAGELAKRCMAAWGWKHTHVEELDRKAWIKARPDALEPIGLHECRHTYASICIAAGINIKTLSTWMGHSSITITLDRYGHMLPGSTQEALGLLNAHLSKETT